MIDPFVLLTPLLLLPIFALLRFVGCFIEPNPPGPHFHPAVPGDGKVFLSWEAVPGGGDGADFHVKRSASPGGPYDQIGIVSQDVNYFTDRDRTNGVSYYYIVTKSEAGLESNNSNEVSAIPGEISILQTQAFEDGSSTNTDTVAATPFPNLDAGSLVVAWVWYNAAAQTVLAVSDTAGNVFKLATAKAGTNVLVGWQQEIWYAPNAVGGSGVIVSALFTGPFAAKKAIVAHVYSNASAGAPFDDPVDVTKADADVSQGVSSGVAAASDQGLIFGAALFSAVGAAGPGFTQEAEQSGNVTEDRRVDGPGPVEATFTNTVPNQSWIAQMVVFR